MANKTRICPECGREWAESVIFCMACGERTVIKTDDMNTENIVSKPVEKSIEIQEKRIVKIEPEEKIEKKEIICSESKKMLVQEKLPDIEDLILAYINKVVSEKNSETFIENIRKIVNQ